MSEQHVILTPAKPRRQDARDLQSRLYREIGLAAVAYEFFAPERAPAEAGEMRFERPVATIRRVGGQAA
ncbi:hypothetical protein [uncultured Rhodoblastus sp.]|uniref:hypothetical protein n=1 Tax=uncultured Rhodoblastus sp. TaxID=543037 RepID=UPI0025F3F0BB|nr:hypothetical protein [uncultured Rhodoblastus sp.]